VRAFTKMYYNYELLPKEKNTLCVIYEDQKNILKLDEDYEKAILQLLELIFNPTKKRSTLLDTLGKLKNVENYPYTDILKEHNYIVVIPTGVNNKISITPEGIIYISNLTNDEKNLLQQKVYDEYRNHTMHKLNLFYRKEALRRQHVAILLFLLLNNSISEDRAFIVQDISDKQYVEKIINPFLGKNENDIKSLYAFNYYLVEVKRILGNVVENKKNTYYLYEKSIPYIINSIKDVLNNEDISVQDWIDFKRNYKNNIAYLRINKNSHYKKSWENYLDRTIFNINGGY